MRCVCGVPGRGGGASVEPQEDGRGVSVESQEVGRGASVEPQEEGPQEPEGEVRAELPDFGLEAMRVVKSPAMGRPMVSRQN